MRTIWQFVISFFCLFLFAGCGSSQTQPLTINVFPIKTASERKMLSATACVQKSIYLVVRFADSGEEISRQPVLLKTALTATSLYGNFANDIDSVAKFLSDPSQAFLDQPITANIPTSGSIEIRIYGNFYDPHDYFSANDTVNGADGICDQLNDTTPTSGALSASSLIGHVVVGANDLKAGSISIPINILDTNPISGTYTSGLNSGSIASHGDWVESDAILNAFGTVTGTSTFQIGSFHGCAVANGSAKCWGANTYGEIGNNTTAAAPTPAAVIGISGTVTSLSANAYNSCAVANGNARCWGLNSYGQLGNNSTTNSSAPVSVTGLTSGVTAIVTDVVASCAVVSGSAMCWGKNEAGVLGNTSVSVSSSVPVQVTGLTAGVTAISLNSYAACAIVNGGAQCWGYNIFGQLGDGTTSNRTTPVAVLGLTAGVQQISVGSTHTCAVVNGAAYCWGTNADGELGNGTRNASYTPAAVLGLSSGVLSLSSSVSSQTTSPVEKAHTCALMTSGSVQCWGGNAYGQLGNNTTFDSLTPVAVQGLPAGVTAISASEYTSCASTSFGIYCWGHNPQSQLGNGTTTDSLLPVLVSGISVQGGSAKLTSVSYDQIKINLLNGQSGTTPKIYLPHVFPYTLTFLYSGSANGCTSGSACSALYSTTVFSAGTVSSLQKAASDASTAPAQLYPMQSFSINGY